MRFKLRFILTSIGIILIVGLLIGSDSAIAEDDDKNIVYESSDEISEDLEAYIVFYDNMGVKTRIKNTGNENAEVKITNLIQKEVIQNESIILEPGEQRIHRASIGKYLDPNSERQVVHVEINDYLTGYEYDQELTSSNVDRTMTSQVDNVQLRDNFSDSQILISISHYSPHTFRQAVWIHTEENQYGTILDEEMTNDITTSHTPTKTVNISLDEGQNTRVNGTLWHYQGFIDDNTVLTKVEFSETEQGELDVEYVEPSPISLETENVHETPTDLEQAQDDALSTADRWLVNDRAPAALVAGVLLVVSYVALRRRDVL